MVALRKNVVVIVILLAVSIALTLVKPEHMLSTISTPHKVDSPLPSSAQSITFGQVEMQAMTEVTRNASLSVQMLNAAIESLSQVDLAPWRTLFGKPHGSTVRVIAFGGSTTQGMECRVPNSVVPDFECAFATRFVNSLNRMFPSLRFVAENEARSGINSRIGIGHVATMLSRYEESTDIVILDFGVNDFVELEEKTNIGDITEALVATARKSAKGGAVMVVIPSVLIHSLQIDVMAWEKYVASMAQRAAVVNMRTAAKCNRDLELWLPANYAKHPNATTHTIIAEMLTYAVWSIHQLLTIEPSPKE